MLEKEKKLKRTINNWLGLLGVISLLSYSAAVILSPLAYPGYQWMSRAVSDLSAQYAPSLRLWTQLSSLYGFCAVCCITLVVVEIQGKLNKGIRTGIYLFAIMQWVSAIGYTAFPLSGVVYEKTATSVGEATYQMMSNFQDTMHIVVTAAVIILSIVSLSLIVFSSYKNKGYSSLGNWATLALVMMLIGGIGSGIVPKELFGLFQRFSNFSAVGFNALLGIYLFNGFGELDLQAENNS